MKKKHFSLKTKSILLKKSKKDGLRICVMRRIRPEYDFDMWILNLAPTEKLLKKYVIDKTMSWEDFSKVYKSKILKNNQSSVKLLIFLTQFTKVTLLCSEKTPKYCHRSLIIEEYNELIKANLDI